MMVDLEDGDKTFYCGPDGLSEYLVGQGLFQSESNIRILGVHKVQKYNFREFPTENFHSKGFHIVVKPALDDEN